MLATGGAAAHEAQDRVKLEWKRDPKSVRQEGEASPPEAPAVPQDLVPAPPAVQAARTAAGDVDAAATRAAQETASELMRGSGWREYWRAGFARGVTVALDDPRIGAWDHEAGLRFGHSDPRVRPLGDHLAHEAAEPIGDSDAESRVKERFMDLSKEPRYSPTDTAMLTDHRYGPSIPEFAGPYAAEPVLDDVFRGYPPVRTAGLSRDGRRAADEWRVEPAALARSDRQARAYDVTWADSQAAFARWKGRQDRGSAYARLSPADREQFRTVFTERFAADLRSADARVLNDAWRTGFADGWRYGAAIQREWSYRRGYAEGFDTGVRETASIAFPYAYEKAYNAGYAHWFDVWSHTAHPGFGAVRIADDNDDGVFEPGEQVRLMIDVVNYGGGYGMFDMVASGDAVAQPSTVSVRLVGRGRVPESQKVSVRIADRVPPRTRSKVILTMGDARTDTPLYVSRPFEVIDAPAIDTDRLEGRVTLTLAVRNTSRRDAPAVVRVDSATGSTDPQRDDLGVIPSGGSKSATVTFTGIHPLDLIGAESKWRVTVARGEQVDDTREVRMAPVATDLGNPDLLDFMIALARTPQVSRVDVQDSRALMMQRLRADWDRATDSDGNPYKRDYDTEGSETVLGQLVRIRQNGRSYVSPQVFDGMGRDAAALADHLPGAHPLLRKWMKKLAARMD